MRASGLPPCQECARGVALLRPHTSASDWHDGYLFWESRCAFPREHCRHALFGYGLQTRVL